MNNSIIVLPSARAIRHKQLSMEGDALFLPNYIAMNDFISKLCMVEDFKTVDNDSRVLLLLEASDFKSFFKLQIQRNFFTFTKNSSYIFKFFEELSAELYDIKNLSIADVYGEYEEHIAILQELYLRYEELCKSRKILDKIFLPKLYSFNENFVKAYRHIELYLEGHLTNFEFELLSKCTQFCTVEIIFNATRFNTKMQQKFLEFGLELEHGFSYKILLNTKEMLQKERLLQNKNITCESFSEPILQAAFVQKKIYDFIKMGYEAQNIAVILPNENFASTLKSFDEKSNLNFAMGEPFSSSDIYKKLEAACMFIEQDSKENEARVLRVKDEFFAELSKIYYKSTQEADILEFLKRYKEGFSDKGEIKIFEEELYFFKTVLPFMRDMSIKSLLSVFLQRLRARTLDDVRGGKITVMGVLETRLVEFDAVVIVDFDDVNVPKKSQKDMFLNSAIREAANLPTMSDRESLQKHYYEMLINRSKEVAISFVKSKESSGSRFLKQLGIKEKNIYSEQEYAEVLFKKSTLPPTMEKEIVVEYSFKDKSLSATKLKTFLTCKRKYYYKYIKQIRHHEIPKDMPKEHEIGLSVHEALKNLYMNRSSYTDELKLQKDLYAELDNICKKSELERYLIAMQKRKMESFCQNEIKRFKEGWQVYKCEEKISSEFAGVTIEGIIDRIDKREGEIAVLDYKTGSYALYTEKNLSEATDFQLEFYYLLAQKFGNVTGCGYYDLRESRIVEETFLQEKLAFLESHVKDMINIENLNCTKCEDLKSCINCEYKIMCGRE